MPLTLKIAWRNLWRHRSHSLVVGTILCLGAMLMTVGNGVVSGMDRGLQRTVVRGFTGDLVLVPDVHEGDNVFLEIMGKTLEPIDNFTAVRPVLERTAFVESFLPVGKNMAMILNDEGGMPFFLYILGVDFERYNRTFPSNRVLIEGREPEAGKPGLLLPAFARHEIHDMNNVWFIPVNTRLDTSGLDLQDRKRAGDLNVKSGMVLMGFNGDNSTTDILLDVNGIFRYRALNTIFGHFALMDIESYRQVLGYFRASEKIAEPLSSRDSTLFIADDNLDDLFSGDSLMAGDRLAAPGVSPNVDWKPGAGAIRGAGDPDEGTYNLVLLLLKPGTDPERAAETLNERLRRDSLGVRAVSWKAALGPVGSMATLIKGALFAFVTLLFLVAIIIIVNTLSMAALERTPEIGMMRAIGARRGFIGTMFLAETAALSAAFGGLGMGLGVLIVEILAQLRLSSENDMLQLLFGGDTFRPVLTPWDLGLTLIQLAFVTVAAVLYPLLVARGVTPLHAAYKE
jgi:ABC-type lipoprotein release transport system permease subunit